MSLTIRSALRPELTFKFNAQRGRHGWLRLTPAYSMKIVASILDSAGPNLEILDPFSGTGTTGLVSAERGYNCTLVELNPFLVWLARAKTRNYRTDERESVLAVGEDIVERASAFSTMDNWAPPIRDISRWWSADRLRMLAAINALIERNQGSVSTGASDLLRVAFCRCMIDSSNVAFNHQSMSFKEQSNQAHLVGESEVVQRNFLNWIRRVSTDAAIPLRGEVDVVQDDSRSLLQIRERAFDLVVTSPPYPNRMSYVRELRPYMYWLRYLTNSRDAGEMDWKAIGGTWGVATSRLTDWSPRGSWARHRGFQKVLRGIREHSPLLANYVQKYFEDMFEHFGNLRSVLREGSRAVYIVGNSKFYDVMLPTETLFSEMMTMNGFQGVEVRTLRKRTSKKELYEFAVSGVFRPS